MKELMLKENYNLDETIAKDLFEGVTYPWEVLPKIGAFIKELGATLDPEEYEKRGEDVWVAKSAKVFESAYINGPAIIGKNAEVRHCAFIRGNAIVGQGAVVGNSTELKNVVLFNKVQVPHYNYVGDSVLGYKAHMGAGSIISNLKSEMITFEVESNSNYPAALYGSYVSSDTGENYLMVVSFLSNQLNSVIWMVSTLRIASTLFLYVES